jgi:hypothetical protein
MKTLEQRTSNFLYELIFNDGVAREVREQAYQLHIEIETGQTPKVQLMVPSTRVPFYLSRPIYKEITDYQRAHQLINGIKIMREQARNQNVDLGLKDAKDIIDAWDDRL